MIAVLCMAGLSACGTDVSGAVGPAAAADGLTIQGDAGSPNLIEDFNPYAGSQLHGTYLLYEPLELVSGFNGAYTPYLATSYKFTSPTTLVYTLRSGVKWSDGQPLTSADAPPSQSKPKSGHVSWATCKPSWSQTSLRVSRAALAPTFT